MSDMNVGAVRSTQSTVGVEDEAGTPEGEGAGTASLLPSSELDRLMQSGDTASIIAALMTKLSREDKKENREAEEAESIAAWKAGEEKVQALNTKADHIASEGWLEGVATMAQGACDIGAGSCGIDTAGDRKAAAWRGMGEGFSGFGKIASSGQHAKQVTDDADAERAGNAKDAAERWGKMRHEDVQDASEMLRRIAEWYSDMKKAKESTMQSAIHRA